MFPSPGLNGPTFLAIEPTVAGPLTAKVCGLAIYDRIHLFQHSIPKGLSTRHDKLSKYPRPALPRLVNRQGTCDGFPCFSHHGSVSALWARKWRKPCAAGIYPFTDADVADFDPIFEELVK